MRAKETFYYILAFRNERMRTNLTFPAYFKVAQIKIFVESLSFQLLLFGRIQFFHEELKLETLTSAAFKKAIVRLKHVPSFYKHYFGQKFVCYRLTKVRLCF